MVWSSCYSLSKAIPSAPHLLIQTFNNDKLISSNIDGRSSSLPNGLFSGPYKQLGRSFPTTVVAAAKFGGFSLNAVFKKYETCGGQGAIECPGCKGTGKNRKNGNIFERWKCFECQGFGLKSCPECGKGGLTPEQRGER